MDSESITNEGSTKDDHTGIYERAHADGSGHHPARSRRGVGDRRDGRLHAEVLRRAPKHGEGGGAPPPEDATVSELRARPRALQGRSGDPSGAPATLWAARSQTRGAALDARPSRHGTCRDALSGSGSRRRGSTQPWRG